MTNHSNTCFELCSADCSNRVSTIDYREVEQDVEKKVRRGVGVGMTGVLNHITYHV